MLRRFYRYLLSLIANHNAQVEAKLMQAYSTAL